ncbi:hypothetical protein DH2020_037166 [Rehmannia glutinosa]|uniref:glucan endo-1,3-beta-D-glucosidase n=1 Tax=Rehmannia glutinosa TaxID=99300 RepID=A0ABR0V3A0_REHGL
MGLTGLTQFGPIDTFMIHIMRYDIDSTNLLKNHKPEFFTNQKIRRRVKTIVTKPFKQKPRRKPPPSSSPSPPTSPAMSPPHPPPQTTVSHHSRPFLFPQTQSRVLPDPSTFFSPHLLSTPLPTNSFFQNFVLKNGDQPEYIHPYLIKSSQSSLTLCFPSLFKNPAFIYQLNNNQTWLLYASSPINLSHDINRITSSVFSGVIRIAALPNAEPKFEAVLDRFSSCYAVSGDAVFTKPFCLEYKWDKRGWGDLLMLAHPLHLKLLSDTDCSISVIEDFKYNSIDGELVGVVGDSWVLKSDPVSVTWHSIKGIQEECYSEIIEALIKDVEALDSSAISTSSSYFYAKLIARAARLALIAEEVCYPDVIPAIRKFLKDTIEPWMEGTFGANGFMYDAKWGGIVTKQGSLDSGADFGFGVYNDHHYHLGYFIYGISVLAKIDAAWGRKYRPQAYSLMADYMNLSKRANSNYTRLRCFDLWKLHSWAGGLTEFADGRNQESTSEAVNAYYSAALMGLAYGDSHLVSIGSTISAFEIQAAQTWWHVKEDDNLYPEEFTRENRVVGVLWANKRDGGLWFAPPDWRECRLGIQLLPLLPISEALFSDVRFVRQLVTWTLPALAREGVGEGWKGFTYALQGVYDKEGALDNIRKLNGYDDGNSLSNLLWWIHSRDDDQEEGCDKGGKFCWFRHYCH